MSDGAEPVRLPAKDLTQSLRKAAKAEGPNVVWVGAGGQLLVRTQKIVAGLKPGVVLVGLPVYTDETGDVVLTVSLLVGSKGRNLGLSFAAPSTPSGPDRLTGPWGDAVTAFVWDLVLRAAVASLADKNPGNPGFPTRRGGRRARPVDRSKISLPAAVYVDREDLVIVPRTPVTFESLDLRKIEPR